MDALSTSTINNLINSSRQSEYSKRISPLLQKKTKFTNLSNVWNSLKTKLSSFKSLLSNLKDVNSGGSFTSKTAELSNGEYFSVTANSGASLSSYDIRVNQLAKNDRVMSDTVATLDSANLSAGTYSIQVASGEYDQVINFDLAGSETKEELMEKIAEAINEALGDAVTASIFSPINGESKLSLQAIESGSESAITIKDVTGGALDSIGMNFSSRTLMSEDGSGGYLNSSSELDAKLTLNGVSVVRGSNTIDDLISDVIISLKNEMEVGIPTVNVIVKNNMEAARTDIDDFIAKFNESYSYIKNNYYADEDGSRGIFVGNATALGLMQSFSTLSYQQVEGISDGNFKSLSEIGIKFDPASGLKVDDSEKLNDALESNPQQVADLFNSENGIANKFYDLVESYVSNDGVISNLIDQYDSSLTYLADKISYREEQIDSNAAILRKKYEQMQMQLATIYSTQSSMSALGVFDY
ncbi:MAG: flagellar filament capping protein FliD [Ignavibacteriae bacterium]|nr:flagellar filament capping protein FliD [Ignavibacteriota bacterium]MCB9206142.1 flagellar filament capping protein FliD [Ignavibacteriales bacterium]MCB9209415.1 flagellar filament capping protein FliD [Ignavibacteriales bacterium]MCB9258058.1 flagellar filament capping protein FliD [Ignavibacteriales bacterium]